MNRPALVLGLVLGLAAIAAAHPPASTYAPAGVTVRRFEVPQPPLVIERPPRIFEEITQTVEVTPRRAEVLDYAPAWSSIDYAPAYAEFDRGRDRGRLEVLRVGPLGGTRYIHRDRDGRLEVLRVGPLGGTRYFARDR